MSEQERMVLDVMALNPVVRGGNYLHGVQRLHFGPRYNYGYQIVYVFDQTGEAVIDEQTYEMWPGDLFLYGPGDRHIFKGRHEMTAGTLYFSWTRVGPEKLATRNGCVRRIDAEYRRLADPLVDVDGLPRIPWRMRIPEQQRPPVELLIREIGETFLRMQDHLQLHHKALLLELIHLLRRLHSGRAQSMQHRQIQKFQAYMRKNFNKELTRSLASRDMGISESYLALLLRRELDTHFTAYLNDLRLQMAMQQLRYSSLLIKEICHHVGFNDESYFIACFRRKYGHSPQALRASLQSM